MHRRFPLLLAAALAAVPAALMRMPNASAAPPEDSPAPRSLWVWNTAPIRAGGAVQDEFFRFLAAPKDKPKNAIGTVYFDGLPARKFAEPETVSGLRAFLKAAHARHLRVDFLTGDAHWATEKAMPEGLATLDAVLKFNRDGAGADERFDGFQYDVEPYSLPGWPSLELRQGLLTLLDKSRAAIGASGQKLLLTAAIPRWYDQAKLDFLDHGVIDRTDEVLIMDYVRKPENLVADAAEELQYAAKAGKKVWIGVETKELPGEPTSTFYGLGDTAMEATLSAALPKLRPYSSFAGYAIHHWATYTALKP